MAWVRGALDTRVRGAARAAARRARGAARVPAEGVFPRVSPLRESRLLCAGGAARQRARRYTRGCRVSHTCRALHRPHWAAEEGGRNTSVAGVARLRWVLHICPSTAQLVRCPGHRVRVPGHGVAVRENHGAVGK